MVSEDVSTSGHVKLHIPAPSGLMREEAMRSHIATRNFFAWLSRKPIVGHQLGPSLADVLGRMKSWRSASVDNVEDLLMYADQMGYSSVEHRPDHALAMLALSESAHIPHVWIDSFAHCVGMNGEIGHSNEFASISRATKALITRAYLEMDLHLDRTSRSLVSFLEHELCDSYLGISDSARHHLDRFRTFLYTYHVAKHGYWPPYSPTNYPKDLYYDLYSDFSCLYHFLADKDVKEATDPLKPALGGICVEQNIEQFNRRHKFNPLPHTLPLLPRGPTNGVTKPQRSLRSLKAGVKEVSMSKTVRADKARLQLRVASNYNDESVLRSGLVQQYITWEDTFATHSDENVSLADARKVRWILIYATLQTLVSAIQAPPEVRDTRRPKYPLCILTSGLPPWENDVIPPEHQLPSPVESLESQSHTAQDVSRENAATPTISVQPDCEEQVYLNYWSNSNGSRENVSSQSTSSLRRASTRLRKNTFKRRSLIQQDEPDKAPQPKLVAGRTLAELAYGEPSVDFAASGNAFHEFDFGFGSRSSDQESKTSVENELMHASSIAWSSKSTFDDFHDSLSHQSHVSFASESSDSVSVPSLTFSHSSRETLDSFHSGYTHLAASDVSSVETPTLDLSRANSKDSEKHVEAMVSRLSIAKQQNGINSLDGEAFAPRTVTQFTDFLQKEVDSNATSPGSIMADEFDRAAAIENDGVLNATTTDPYELVEAV